MDRPKFNSIGEFLRELWGVIKLAWRKRKSLMKQDPLFRENINLAVTLVNDCSV